METSDFDHLTSPVIGISGSSSDSASVRAMMTQIRSAGATPLFLGNHKDRIARCGGNVEAAVAADLQKIDALVVMGNNGDIDPRLYGQQPGAHTTIEKDKAREAYEFALLADAIRQKMPVMGICGGHQRINVLCGGTLDQHVPDQLGNNSHAQQDEGIPPFCPVQLVKLEEKTMLSALAEMHHTFFTPSAGFIAENSMHHQAVNKVGQGLRVAARSTDGTIEAIEADPAGPFANQVLLGVQWHPEFGASTLGPKLAGALTVAAHDYAKETQRSHPMHEAVEENIFSSAPAILQKQRAHMAQPTIPGGHLARLKTRSGMGLDGVGLHA